MTVLLISVHVMVCLVLILVILLQAGRGQGLSAPSFGSGNVQSLFGTRAADFLTKATSIAAICFLFTCIGLNIVEVRKSRSLLEHSKPTVPLDVDAIKKALEKVKKEAEGQKTPEAQTATSAETKTHTGAPPQESIPSSATPKAETQTAAKTALADAPQK